MEESFYNLCLKFSQLTYGIGKSSNHREAINKILDDLNKIDYRYAVITNITKAVLLVNQCCTLVSPEDSLLVSKSCQLITNLINRHRIKIEGKTLNLAIQWCFKAFKEADKAVTIDVLITLDALIRSNTNIINTYLAQLIGHESPIFEYTNVKYGPETNLLAIQCLEACTLVPNDYKSLDVEKYCYSFKTCADIFLNILITTESKHSAVIFHYKLVISCLNGLHNIIIHNEDYLDSELGFLLGITKTYMVFDIKNVGYIFPQKLMPSAFSIPEITTKVNREKKGGKVTKQRKQRYSKTEFKKPDDKGRYRENPDEKFGYVPASVAFLTESTNISEFSPNTSFYGNKLKTSDSEVSDSETGRIAKLHTMTGKIRQSALKLILTIVNLTDKRTIFCYWSSFIPDGSPAGMHSLLTCILKDPSPSGRMAALNVLMALLNMSKIYLSQAEDSDHKSAFTPFSIILGSMITELHKCLSLALNDNSVPVVTQVLKCLAYLVQATPYHRLKPGLLSKIIRNVKWFINHKNVTVQVTALIVLGCIVATEPVLPEVANSLLKKSPQLQKNVISTPKKEVSAFKDMISFNRNVQDIENTNILSDKLPCNKHEEFKKITESKTTNEIVSTSESTCNKYEQDEEDIFEYANFSSSDDEIELTSAKTNNLESLEDISWLLCKCLQNLGVNIDDIKCIEIGAACPIKLESLQVISALSRNYFDTILASYLPFITKGLENSFKSQYIDVKLHGGRTTDSLGQAVNQYLSNNNDSQQSQLISDSALSLWLSLLSGPLTSLIQNDSQHETVKAVACDCFGSIGPHIFERLPRDKQLFLVTLLFACTRDKDSIPKGAAVRALAICVMYPSLREDAGFIIDTAHSIHSSLQDKSIAVRIKASWALGNLSDVLVASFNNSSTAEGYNEELSDNLLIELISDSIKGCKENDNIKSNSIRALGNLLLLVTEAMLENGANRDVVVETVMVLVKSANGKTAMKVRWNACYAIGSMLKNRHLYSQISSSIYQEHVFPSLTDLVVNSRHFKVRINAALALSVPSDRSQYGSSYFSIINSLLNALENSENMDDFSEYKHLDHLVDQICLSFGHLISLLNMEDISIICDAVALHKDLLHVQVHKVLERLLPEKSTILINAKAYLTNLSTNCESRKQKKTLNNLVKIFTVEAK